MKQEFDFHKVISTLRKSRIVSNIEIKTVDEIKGRGIYKVRCGLIPSKYKLEIRFVRIEEQILYSYQFFSDIPIIRWDNSPHYSKIKTYPHHFHARDGMVIDSELGGNVVEDLETILSLIETFITDYE